MLKIIFVGSLARFHMENLRRQIPSTLQTLQKLHEKPEDVHLGKNRSDYDTRH